MTSTSPTVLVSGASVAGPVVAYWLNRFGIRTTVVERAPELRLGGGGHAVDLFGPALQVLDWMGVGAQIRAARTRTEIVSFARSRARPVEVDAERLSEGVSDQHVEIMRGDLARIVYEASHADVEYRLGDSITTLQDTGRQVEVAFEHSAPQAYDLVIGADGLHSRTRRLVFGPEHEFLHFLGGYLAVFSVPNYLHLERRMLSFAGVGRTVSVYPTASADVLRVLFLFRTPAQLDFDHHDTAAQHRLLRTLYDGIGWEVPRLLAELDAADDFYLDSISQIRMDHWSLGRVTLVGDAGYSPGPAVGGGTSLAVVGAYVLAAELAGANGDHAAGLSAYEQAMREAVTHSRSIGPAVLRMLVPTSTPQIWLTSQVLRLLPQLPRPVRRRLTSFGGGPAAMLNGVRLREPDSSGSRTPLR